MSICINAVEEVLNSTLSGSGEVTNQTLYSVANDSTFIIVTEMPSAGGGSLSVYWTDPENNSRSSNLPSNNALGMYPARVKGGTLITYQISGATTSWAFKAVVVKL